MEKQPITDAEHDNKTAVPPPSDPKPEPNQKTGDNHAVSGDGNNWGSFVMGSDPPKSETKAPPPIESELPTNLKDQSASSPGSRKTVRWSPDLVTESHAPRSRDYDQAMPVNDGSNPYVSHGPSPQSASSLSFKDAVVSVKDVLGRWGKRVGEATKKAEDLAGNTWQHLRTSPSFADAALGRIAQGTKVLAEGGYEKIFRQTFETVPEEQLQNSFACYLSTSAGPVMGILYVSTAKLAFCSDNPLSYQSGDKTEWSYYKVVIPLHQLKAVNPSSSRTNRAEKYIQVISIDNHEFWFMGFLNYDGAVKSLQETLQARSLESV